MMEKALVIKCNDAEMVGILHQPSSPAKTGLVVVVAGGPQYRVGVSRQFVMLGRTMAKLGHPTLRLDHRGVGDSGGAYKGYMDMSDDIQAAIDALFEAQPELESVALWGECESATAISFYAFKDSRVSSIFLVNPWIRTEEGQAKTYIKHYYLNRLISKALWKKILKGQFDFSGSVKSFLKMLSHSASAQSDKGIKTQTQINEEELKALPLPLRLARSCAMFEKRIDILTSGRDFIAQEFNDFTKTSDTWQHIFTRDNVFVAEIADADHSFSRIEWREQLFNKIASSMNSLRGQKSE